MSTKNKRCPKCGQSYQDGRTGIRGMCDRCAGITRDSKGRAWAPAEDRMEVGWWDPINKTTLPITRDEAFGK